MCSGFFQSSYKRGKYLFFKRGNKGANYRYNALQFVTLYLSNILVNALSVTVCYNSLQSVK